MHELLTEAQAAFLRDEKEALAEIQQALGRLDVPREALATLQKAILQLDELFLLVVVGEFNAGKSALMNALLGAGPDRVLAEGVTPTTSRVTLVKWGPQVTETVVDENFTVYTHPLPLLRELNIVDTPGTNAVIREHERLTEEFVPRSDLLLFVTSADRPLTESERQFLERILDCGRILHHHLAKVRGQGAQRGGDLHGDGHVSTSSERGTRRRGYAAAIMSPSWLGCHARAGGAGRIALHAEGAPGSPQGVPAVEDPRRNLGRRKK